MTQTIRYIFLTLMLSVPLVISAHAWAEQSNELSVTEGIELSAGADNEADESLMVDSESAADKRREMILSEAVEALEETEKALKALEEGRTDDALDALALTTGRLEVIVAREPELALATTDVSVSFNEIIGSNDSIKNIVDAAKDALRDGRVQDARQLLNNLTSEIVTTETALPLATYPAAITAIVPLIDAGQIDMAIDDLKTVLSTKVLTDYVTPLPYLRAEVLLERAEELAEMTERSEVENDELTSKLGEVKEQLELGQLLGYGSSDDYKSFRSQLDKLQSVTSQGKHGSGFFTEIKETMSGLWSSIHN